MPGPSRLPARAPLRVDHLEDRSVPTASPLDYDPTRVLVAVSDPTQEAARVADLARSPLAAGVQPLGLGVYRVDLAAGVSVNAAVSGLGRLPGVVAAPDYHVAPESLPNDPQAGNQWALGKVSAATGWNAAHGTGHTIVAVIDTGVDYTHPDLAANMWHNPGEVPGNGKDDDGDGIVDDVYGVDFLANSGNPMDDAGHGTHVAGIIGAVGNNGIGVSGVAWTTQIMALRFMSATGGGYTSDAVRALDYAVAHGAGVVNMSWGGDGYYAPLAAAIGRARTAGTIVVAAAGNNAANTDVAPYYPAGYIGQLDNVVTVAATDSSDNLASYSNYGPNTVTLAAPGSSILSTLPGGGYGTKSGTSMATPFVTGAIAVLRDEHPDWSYQQVIAKLKASVDPLPSLAGKVQTGGRLDLAKLFDAPAPVPVPPPPPVSPPPVSGGLTVTSAVFGGPKAGVFDRVWVQFSQPVDPATLAAGVSVSGPGGAFNVSAILPVAGTNNTQFTLMFSRNQTAPGTYSAAFAGTVRGTSGATLTPFTATAALGSAGTPAVPPTSPPPVSPPAPTTARATYAMAGGPLPIQDHRTTRIDIPVTGTFTVSDLNVTLDVAHGRTWDLNIRIVAPDGRSVTLFNRRGGTGANLSGTTFDDQAAASIATAAAPFAGSFRPEQALSLFNGMNARGVWSVQVFDLADGAGGTVNGVTLRFAGGSSGQSVPNLAAADLRGAGDGVREAVLGGLGDRIAAPTRRAWA